MDEPNFPQSWQMNPPQGEPLYTFDTHETEKLYRKRLFLLNRTRLLTLDFYGVLLAVWFGRLLNLGRYTLFLCLFLLLAFFLVERSTAKKAYKKRQRIQTGLIHYAFYEDCFTVQASFGQALFRYEDLYQIRIRKNSICLIAAAPYCFALLPGEYPDELPDFLCARAPKRTGQTVKDALCTLLRIILAIAAVFCFLVFLMVLQDSENGSYADSTPSAAESYTEDTPSYTPTPTPTPTDLPVETATPEESTGIFDKDYIGRGYGAIYNTYIKDISNTLTYGVTAKGEDYYIVNDTEDAVEILQYDRESANGSCGLYVYERCKKDAYGSWSRQEAQILNIYAYHYWDGVTAASGKTGWGDASALDYRELTGE